MREHQTGVCVRGSSWHPLGSIINIHKDLKAFRQCRDSVRTLQTQSTYSVTIHLHSHSTVSGEYGARAHGLFFLAHASIGAIMVGLTMLAKTRALIPQRLGDSVPLREGGWCPVVEPPLAILGKAAVND